MPTRSLRRLVLMCGVGIAVLLAVAIPHAAWALDCPDCNDGFPCTIDSCDVEFGTCRHEVVSCDDGNLCTDDSCSQNGCAHNFIQMRPCDDGNPCTQGDVCWGLTCSGNNVTPPGGPCDDHNPCTVNDTCDAAHVCVSTPLPAGTSCDDANVCTAGDACVIDPGQGVRCAGGPSFPCDDGDACTVDICDPSSGCWSYPIECDDGNPCTNDSCDAATGRCLHLPGPTSACAGPSPCAQYACDRGNCTHVGGPMSCDDGIACTRDQCAPELPSGCRHVPDASLCGGNPFCRGYACIEGTGCVQTYDNPGRVCSTFNECINSTCQGGVCLPHNNGPETPCNVGNPCVNGHCQNGGCFIEHVNEGLPCNDQNICTSNDRCTATGQCAGTNPCDDGIACTVDSTISCLPPVACAHQPVAASEAGPLHFNDEFVLQWVMSPDATLADTYRGTIPPGLMGSRPPGTEFDHACYESGDAFFDGPEITRDPTKPPIGTCYYYLVSDENPCGESGLGKGFSGSGPTSRPNVSPCPTPP